MTFDTHAFWRNPDASDRPDSTKAMCRPDYYIGLNDITALIVEVLSEHLDKGDSIIELGAGTGRNLAGLKDAGFKRLRGIEINPDAIQLGRKSFQALDGIEIYCDTVEGAIEVIPHYDCIFTQGLLQHLPPKSDWVHAEIANRADKLIMLIENEKPAGVRSWARNYKDIFEGLGWHEVESRSDTGCKGHAPSTIVRVLKK